MKPLTLIILALFFTGCGTIWTLGFMGATLSIQFPLIQQIQPVVMAAVTTAPSTQGAPK